LKYTVRTILFSAEEWHVSAAHLDFLYQSSRVKNEKVRTSAKKAAAPARRYYIKYLS